MEHQKSIKQSSAELVKLIDMMSYITRTDNPYVFYEYYMTGHSPLEMYNQRYNSSIADKITAKSQDRIITSEELAQILNQLIALQESGIEVESKRIPLLSSEYKFKGYRQVEFSYKDSNGIHTITVTNKKKEIYFKQKIGKGTGKD